MPTRQAFRDDTLQKVIAAKARVPSKQQQLSNLDGRLLHRQRSII
ncbi:MAG: hypothetical protein ACOYXA_13980 [Bacteroidota bacterium]